MKEYAAISEHFNTRFIQQKNILVFPSAPDLQNAFQTRLEEENSFIKSATIKRETLNNDFNFPFSVFEILPCYVINIHNFLSSYRQYLQSKNILIDELFDETLLTIKDDSVQYKNISAKKIIYANGIETANSKYLINLPFVPNKGQALILEMNELNTSHIYKFGHLTLIPWKENLWWCGSSNELTFKTTEPTEDFKKRTIASLKSILKTKFSVKEHWSSLRPATVERNLLLVLHPLHKQIAILNGMGSKGCSLAPWFAKNLLKISCA